MKLTFALLILISIVLVFLAGAQAAPARLAIADFRGPHAGRIQGAAESGLMARYHVVPDFSVRRAARQNGVDLESDSDFGVVGRSLEVAGFVSAQVLPKRASWRVRLEVRRGDTGAPLGSFVLADRRLDGLESRIVRQAPAQVQRLLARRDADPVEVAAAEPPEAPATEPAAVVESAPAPQPPGAPFAELSLEGRLFTRSFSYAQNLSGLPDYRLARALSAALDLTLYPLALLRRRALPPIGLAAALEYAPGVKSRAAGGEQARETRVHAYRLGMKYRLDWSKVSLAPQVGYGRQTFETGATPAAPDVRYQFLWLGADGRVALGTRLSLFGSAAYLHGLSVGGLGATERFPRASAHGAAFELGAGLAVFRGLELRLAAGVRRFGLAMHSRPGDALVAGGAVDQLTWAGLGLAYRPAVSP
jgi:hypothetical protein